MPDTTTADGAEQPEPALPPQNYPAIFIGNIPVNAAAEPPLIMATQAQQLNPLAVIKSFFAAHPKCTALIVEFDGQGDNGNTEPAIPACNVQKDISDYKPLDAEIALDQDVIYAAETVAQAALDKQGLDWYNNDGGYGRIAILRHGRVCISTNIRFTSSENHKSRYNMEQLCTPGTTQ